MALEDFFPNLPGSAFRNTSPQSPMYNCIAWAVGDDTRWWWPDPMELGYWPAGVHREETLDSFRALFSALGFEPCEHAEPEADIEKIALYAKGQQPTHAARQLESGVWTSKLGPLEDIQHQLDDLVGDAYGSVADIFRRQR